MARRTVLTGRQRSALFSLPQHEADLLRHYTLSDEDLPRIVDSAQCSTSLNSARVADRPPPSPARIRATSRSDFLPLDRPERTGRRGPGAHAAPGRTRRRLGGGRVADVDANVDRTRTQTWDARGRGT